MTNEWQIDERTLARLDEWGRFCLSDRGPSSLDFPAKNMLQVVIDHRGEMPAPTVGYKPEVYPPEAWEIETIVSDLYKSDRVLACVLRAAFCTRGRLRVERKEWAEWLAKTTFSRRQFMALYGTAVERVRETLSRCGQTYGRRVWR